MSKRRVVVTGMGCVCPVGNTVKETWDAIKAGKCGIDKITHYDVTDRKVTLAGEVKNLNIEDFIAKKEMRTMDRYTMLAMVAAHEAFEDSALDMEKENANRCGALVSSGIGGIATIEAEQVRGMKNSFDMVSPYFIPKSISNLAAGQIAIKYGLKGMVTCVVTACAGGTNAVGEAFHHIRDGYSDVMLCGGAEAAITPLSIGGFTSMGALSKATDKNRASIPFDKERNGFVMGEGAAILVLEEYEHAKARGAKIYGEVKGYATNCDAYHITSPMPDAEGAAICMNMALEDGGLKPEDVNYINAHGTSTPLNDKGETKAVKAVFGANAKNIPISSTKSMTGHLLGATGAVESVISVMSIVDGFIPATINYKVPDEECDLDIVPNEGRKAYLNVVMSNSLGFGGHNASIVFAKC
ncbi:MAG: beta-ketoacyl-ACP synthase II [Parasporobacterium sp.]|nr:beta-ketoacyl-ACP synthase II [Parasporobacterium sp.]